MVGFGKKDGVQRKKRKWRRGGGEGEEKNGRENWNEVEGDKGLTMQSFVWANKSLK